MSFCEKMIGLHNFNESDNMFPEDNSGFCEADEVFGVDKMEQPSGEGYKAALYGADQFSIASDGENTDVDLSINNSFPKDNSGFDEESNSEIEYEDLGVDPNTIPAFHSEVDQYEEEDDDDFISSRVPDEDLISDDIDSELTDDSGWDD